jgi:hypothetical protein
MLLVLLLTVSSWTIHADSNMSFKPDWDLFQSLCRQHRQSAEVSQSLHKGTVTFVPVGALEATQTRFSFERFLAALKKVKKAVKKPWTNDGGRSAYPIERATAGILYRGKIYITDGHHRALVSTYLGAESIPVQIIDVVPDRVRPKRFFQNLSAQGLSYYKTYQDEELAPVDLCEMENDDYLLLARLLLLRVDLNYDNGRITLLDVRGNQKNPIAIKVNRDIPFLEFEIADRLRRAGFQWQPGQELTRKTLRHVLAILKAYRDGSRLEQVLLLGHPTSMAKLKVPKVVSRFLKVHPCEYKLMNSDKD